MIADILPLLVFATGLVQAQLSGPVGPTTPLSSKSNICNILDYGGCAGGEDIGPAITDAFYNCVKKTPGSTLYVPEGNYTLSTWVGLDDGSKWAFRLDGWITRGSPAGGNMIVIHNAYDFEFYSANSKGGIQGNGYQTGHHGPRFLRIISSTNFSIHDLILVDSPAYFITVAEGSNGEIYNLVIKGANLGESDGIDISGHNHWVHDVEVTNHDECVTIKSPASNILVENVWCNQSGGCSFGSLGIGTAVSNIEYSHIYANGGIHGILFKTGGGSGYVKNVSIHDFIVRETTVGLRITQYYWKVPPPGPGVEISNVTFANFNGNVVNGTRKPPIDLECTETSPCTDITLSNVNMWSETGKAIYRCESVSGTWTNSGTSCLKPGSERYSPVIVNATQPAGYSTPKSMPGDLPGAFDPSSPIPVPDGIPTSFFPGIPAIKPLMSSIDHGNDQ